MCRLNISGPSGSVLNLQGEIVDEIIDWIYRDLSVGGTHCHDHDEY